ncbi:MAG: hypothetical protein ACTSVV_14455 [Promethearchaeota archaeon]
MPKKNIIQILNQYLTQKEIANLLGIGERTVRRWKAQGLPKRDNRRTIQVKSLLLAQRRNITRKRSKSSIKKVIEEKKKSITEKEFTTKIKDKNYHVYYIRFHLPLTYVKIYWNEISARVIEVINNKCKFPFIYLRAEFTIIDKKELISKMPAHLTTSTYQIEFKNELIEELYKKIKEFSKRSSKSGDLRFVILENIAVLNFEWVEE